MRRTAPVKASGMAMLSGTERRRMPSRSNPGTLAISERVMFSSGWMPMTSRLGCIVAPFPAKILCGTQRNWITISVTRLGRRLPVRR